MRQRFLNNAYKPNSSWIYSLHNGLTTSNPRQFDVDITSIGRGSNFDEFPRHFRVLFFDVILMVEKSTSFPHTFFDVISLVEKSMLFPRTLFDAIWMVGKFTLFPRTFIVVISLVENSTLFPRTFFDVITMAKKSMLFPRTLFDSISMIEISTLFLLNFFDVILMGKNSISFLVSFNFKKLTFARFSLKFSSRSSWFSLVPLKFESFNLHHCKKNCCRLVFLIFTEQLLYRIILGQLYCY